MAAHKVVLFFLLLVSFFSCGNTPRSYPCRGWERGTGTRATDRVTLHSTFVQDSFDIYVTLPPDYANSQKSFPLILYMDANLKSGQRLRTIVDELREKQSSIDAVFVGVGHFGNYHAVRRRDFIPPSINENDSLISDDPMYGQAERFYSFLRLELIPYIEGKYRVTPNRTLIGHSLGGLFTFYCLFKKGRLFTNFVALSPSLWVNNENMYDFLMRYRRDSADLHARLYLCVGGAEKLNFILSGAHKMRAYLEKNRFESLHFEYQEFPGETHNSEVPLALNKLLPALRLQ
jgi:predicted alpha/beta superfamily hydrolase